MVHRYARAIGFGLRTNLNGGLIKLKTIMENNFIWNWNMTEISPVTGLRNQKVVSYFTWRDKDQQEVDNEAIEGKWTYLWKTGSKGVGTFANDLHNRTGMFISAKGNTRNVEYKKIAIL